MNQALIAIQNLDFFNGFWKERRDFHITIAETIYNDSHFELAMIGEEVWHYESKEMTLEDIENITCILPVHLQKRLGIEGKGETLSKQLRLFKL